MSSDTRWTPFVKQLVVVAILVAVVFLLSRVKVIIAPLIIACFLAYLVSVPVPWLQRNTGWSRTAAVGVVELLVVAVFASLPVTIVPWFINAVNAFGANFAKVVNELLNVTPAPIEITPDLIINLGPFYQPINQWLRSVLGPELGTISDMSSLFAPFASGLTTVLKGALSGVVWFFVILVVGFYIARDGPRFGRYAAERVPDPWRPELGRLWREIAQIWDLFVRGQVLLGIIVGGIVWLLMSILGVRNAPILGVISALLEFVPSIGPVLAAIPGVAFALVLGSSWLPMPNLWFALLVTLLYILIQQVENLYLLPRVVGARIRLHPAVVIIGAFAGGALGGILGILLAAPTIAGARVLGGYTLRKLFDQEPFVEPETPDYRLIWGETVQKRAVAAILFDIDGTLVETDDALLRSMAGRLAFLSPLMSADQRLAFARRLIMALEGPANLLVTLLDRVHLDDDAYRLRRWFRRTSGMSDAPCCEGIEGVTDAMRELRSRGYLLGIVTNRERAEAETVLHAVGVRGLLGAVVTREDVRHMKPHPMPVQMAAQQLGVPANQCIMVGDTGLDVRAGKAAGALAVGVRSGFGQDGDFNEADLVLDSPAQLVLWL